MGRTQVRKFRWPAESQRQGRPRTLNRILVEDGYKQAGSTVGSASWMWRTVDAFYDTPYALESVREFLLQKRPVKIPEIDSKRGWEHHKQLGLNALCMCVWGDKKGTGRGWMSNWKEVKKRAEKILMDVLHSGDKKLIAMLKEMLEKLLKDSKERTQSEWWPMGRIRTMERENAENFATACKYHLSIEECEFCEPSFKRGMAMLESATGSANGLADVMLEIHEDPRKVKDVAAVLFEKVDSTKPPMPEQLRKDAAWVVIVSTAFDPVALYRIEGKENKRLSKMAMDALMSGMQETKPLRFDGRTQMQRTVSLSTLLAISDVCSELLRPDRAAYKKNTPLGESVRKIDKECRQILGEEVPWG